MLRIRELNDAASAKKYYQQSDYYLETPGEWIGGGAERLGLRGLAEQKDFEALCDNLNPNGGQLTAYMVEGRRVGWDFNFNASKSVSLAREIIGAVDAAEGQRIEDAHREAVRYALGMIEADMACRVRDGGKDEDRVTGNMVGMRVTHRTTRPDESDKMPDMSLHDHVVIVNGTWDAEASNGGKWKAAQIGGIKHDAPYYEAVYHNRLAGSLRELGYGVRRKEKGFELAGVSDALISKFSRRTAHIDRLAEELGITSAAGKDKLGATTRLGKIDTQLGELTGYWDGRLSDAERHQLHHLKGEEGFSCDAQEAVSYAIGHMFERQSVVDVRRFYETAIRHGFGSVTPQDIEGEARRQGLLVKGSEATTRDVLQQEGRVIGFARAGRGCWRPLAADNHDALTGLSAEQQAVVRHVWDSSDSVIMIRGGAGTGKTRTMTQAVAGIRAPVVVLAPSAEASRGVLREEGFAEADTVAAFLSQKDAQEKARHGVIWIDEAGLLGMRQLDQLFACAKELGARVVMQGDHRQHGAVERSGVLKLLEEHAGLPVAELAEVRRQTHGGYKEAVAAIAKGDILDGYDKLDALGWIEQTPVFDHNKPLVDAYMQAVADKATALVVAPTHKEADELVAALRGRLKERGLVGEEERRFATLEPQGWTAAERGDIAQRATGGEIVQFVRNSGRFKAGQRVAAAELKPGEVKPEHFAVYQPGEIQLAKGDTIRVTANGRDKSGKHKLNNGAVYQVAGFKGGDIQLTNGWEIGRDFGHISNGLVVTSHASQGKTVDRVFIAMGQESRPAVTREAFYVSVSRGRQAARIFTNIAPTLLRAAIQQGDNRRSATELMGGQEAAAAIDAYSQRAFDERVRETYRRLRERQPEVTPELVQERGMAL